MLRHQFIYIILLVLLWMMRILYSFRITAVIFYVFLLFPAALYALLRIQAARIRLALRAANCMAKKRVPFSLEIWVENKNILPVGRLEIKVRYKNVLSERWTKQTFSFSPERGGESYCFTMASDYSARLQVQLASARFYDALGLFSVQKLSRKKRAQNSFSVIVMPQRYDLSESPICANPYVMVESELYSEVKGGDDSAEIFNIRSYQQGDRMNRIHWKLSVKEDGLMVKEFGLPIDCSVLVLMDVGRFDKSEECFQCRDAVLEAAFSLSFRMVLDGQIHFFAWYDGRKEEIEKFRIASEEDFYEAVGQALQCGGQKQQVNVPLLYFAENERESFSNLFYVSAAQDGMDAAQAMLENRNSAWLSLIFIQEAKKREEARRLEEDGVIVDIVSPDTVGEDLERIVLRKGGSRWDEEEKMPTGSQ